MHEMAKRACRVCGYVIPFLCVGEVTAATARFNLNVSTSQQRPMGFPPHCKLVLVFAYYWRNMEHGIYVKEAKQIACRDSKRSRLSQGVKGYLATILKRHRVRGPMKQ